MKFSQTLQHNSPVRWCQSNVKHEKKLFFLLLYFVFCSVKSWERRRHSFILQAVFSSIVLCCGLPYTRFDFSRVPRSKTRECEGKVETVSAVLAALLVFFFHRFVCLSLHVSARFFFLSFFFRFRMELESVFSFSSMSSALWGRKGDRLKLFSSTSFTFRVQFRFSRIIAYEHSNDETFIEL